jgi:minor extracellular protease Epr
MNLNLKKNRMKVVASILIASSFFLFSNHTNASTLDNSYKSVEKYRVIVRYNRLPNDEFLTRFKPYIVKKVYRFNFFTMEIPTNLKSEIASYPFIESVTSDPVIHEKNQTTDWGIVNTKAYLSHSNGFTGKGVKIAIIDTGVDKNHPDLKIAGGYNAIDGSLNYDDDNGHGTHVAGIIGAQDNDYGTIGVAPDAEIYIVKAIDANGTAYTSDIWDGIDWAMDHHIDIVNMSFGGPDYSSVYADAFKKAYESGILFVAAAGNSFSDPISEGGCNHDVTLNCVDYPAGYDSVIAVGAIDQNNQHADFSSTGPKVEVSAPGVQIYSTVNGETYDYKSGTSMATPYVTGVLALYKEANPTLSAPEIRRILDRRVVDLGDKGKDQLYGYGLVQSPMLKEKISEITLNNLTNIYTDTSKSSTVVKSYKKGSIIIYWSYSRDWYFTYVYVNGVKKKGYVYKNDVDNMLEPSDRELLSGISLPTTLKVYKTPTTSSVALKTYTQGHILKYYSFSNLWYVAVVSVNGKLVNGYIYKNDVENLLNGNERLNKQGITTKTVYVRNSPSIYSSSYKYYSGGTILNYTFYSPNWNIATVYINGVKKTGYIYKKDVEDIIELKDRKLLNGVVSSNDAKIYIKPSTNASYLKKYNVGSNLKFYSFSEHWYIATIYIKGIKHTGYIYSDDVITW